MERVNITPDKVKEQLENSNFECVDYAAITRDGEIYLHVLYDPYPEWYYQDDVENICEITDYINDIFYEIDDIDHISECIADSYNDFYNSYRVVVEDYKRGRVDIETFDTLESAVLRARECVTYGVKAWIAGGYDIYYNLVVPQPVSISFKSTDRNDLENMLNKWVSNNVYYDEEKQQYDNTTINIILNDGYLFDILNGYYTIIYDEENEKFRIL